MHRQYIVVFTFVVIAQCASPVFSQQAGIKAESASKSWSKLEPPADCTCPKEGRWDVQNLKGWMDCTGPVNMRIKLDRVKDKGTIWVLEHDCSSVFGEASKKKDENVLMERVADCSFFGTINGEENGIKMVLDVKWVADGDEFINGEMHSDTSFQGLTCEFYRPFELMYKEPIKERDYAKAKKKMEEKLAKIRAQD